jgi:hypothetical protein
MRRYYAFLFSILPFAQAFTQCAPVNCIDELPAWGGLCQSSFLDGRVGQPYADAISFHVTSECTPASLFDPTLTTASVRITQINSITFTQLPAGIIGVSNQATYTPPVNGCGALSGVPSEAGVFTATVNMSANVNVWPFSLACGGFGPIANNNNPVSFGVSLLILPDPSFSGPSEALCVLDSPVDLVPTGTQGGGFSGPGVSGSMFDPALAGVGLHEVKYIVSAQEGAAIEPATDSLSLFIEVNDDCLGECEAFAGTLGAVDAVPCLETGGTVELIGIPGGDAIVPAGFEVIYVLTEGAGLVIIDAAPSPAFTVSATGLFTLHTLVYDPATLDLGLVEFGVTTGVDVNNLLIQGGGGICASLDVAGAPYVVVECEPPCDADAGTTNGPGAVICLVNEEAQLITAPNGDAVVPDGYVQTYVLTSGAGLVVIDGNADPDFTVTAIGEYRIHSLVIDPLTFLFAVEPGVTTGFDVLDYFATEGVCGDLDPAGAEFLVDICDGLPAASGAGFSAYPNPSAGGFFVNTEADGPAVFELLDISGRVAHRQRIICSRGAANWVLPDAAPGSYILCLSMGHVRREQRVVIQP